MGKNEFSAASAVSPKAAGQRSSGRAGGRCRRQPYIIKGVPYLFRTSSSVPTVGLAPSLGRDQLFRFALGRREGLQDLGKQVPGV